MWNRPNENPWLNFLGGRRPPPPNNADRVLPVNYLRRWDDVDRPAPVNFQGWDVYHQRSFHIPDDAYETWTEHFFFRPLPASKLPGIVDLASQELNDRNLGMCWLIVDECSKFKGEDELDALARGTPRSVSEVHTISRYNTRDAIIWRMIKIKMGIGPHSMWNTVWACVEKYLIAPHRLIVPPEAAKKLALGGIAETWSTYGAGEYYINGPVFYATQAHYHSIGGFVGWNGICMHCLNITNKDGHTCGMESIREYDGVDEGVHAIESPEKRLKTDVSE
jgi:hypothetical protein